MARERKLSELVPNHVFGQEDRHMAPAVVHADRESHHLGHNRRSARPGADDALLTAAHDHVNLLHELLVDVWSLLSRSRHPKLSLLPRATAANNVFARRLVPARSVS